MDTLPVTADSYAIDERATMKHGVNVNKSLQKLLSIFIIRS